MDMNIAARVARMMAFIREVSPLQRMVNSQGLDLTFAAVQHELPGMVLHRYPSGSRAEDWEVPPAWRYIKGVMRDESGREIASSDESPLFVAPYSQPVQGWFDKVEIARHLRTRPDRPEAFALEHRHAYDYSLVDWGITLPHRRWIELPEGRYWLEIEVAEEPGDMQVAELTLPGELDQVICICGHIDELCNDDLSGCALGMELMRSLALREKRRFTYQLLLVPEMFGPLFFIHHNPEVVRRTVGMLNLEAVGAGEAWVLKRALTPDSLVEQALREAMSGCEGAYSEVGFFEGYGNDERVYAWPTLNIPGVALQRFPFASYHTSEDTPEGLDPALMGQALDICERFVAVLEENYVPRYHTQLQPWLTRHGLYFNWEEDPDNFRRLNNLVLFNLDGRRSLLDLALLSGAGFFRVRDYLARFAEKGLVDRLDWRP